MEMLRPGGMENPKPLYLQFELQEEYKSLPFRIVRLFQSISLTPLWAAHASVDSFIGEELGEGLLPKRKASSQCVDKLLWRGFFGNNFPCKGG